MWFSKMFLVFLLGGLHMGKINLQPDNVGRYVEGFSAMLKTPLYPDVSDEFISGT